GGGDVADAPHTGARVGRAAGVEVAVEVGEVEPVGTGGEPAGGAPPGSDVLDQGGGPADEVPLGVEDELADALGEVGPLAVGRAGLGDEGVVVLLDGEAAPAEGVGLDEGDVDGTGGGV